MLRSSQESIIDYILTHIPKSTLVHILMSALGIAKSAAYNYLDHKVQISYNTMQKILHVPAVSKFLKPDDLLLDKHQTIWNYQGFQPQVTNPESFTESIYRYISMLDANKAHIFYTSYEVPIFYYMYFPRLFAFKLFCWVKTIWFSDTDRSIQFEPEAILTPHLVEMMKACVEKYAQIPSTEYWSDEIFDNTIRQLNYFMQMEYIGKVSTCKALVEDLRNCLGLMRDMSNNGFKALADKQTQAAEFTVYRNEIYFTSNIIVVKLNDAILSFCVYDNPNFLVTSDHNIGTHTLEWLNKMQRGCTRITQNNELVRHDYFTTLDQKLDFLAFNTK